MPSPRERVALGAVLAAAVAWWVLVPTYPAYDAYWHLVWGRELLGGSLPSFEVYAAPTQHPLYVAVAAAFGLVGEDADRLLVLAGLLSLVALVAGTWRLGRVLFGTGPAVLASAFVGSSFAFLLYAVRAYVDVPFLALVVWAAVRQATLAPGASARRRAVPLVLLLLAGLLRPEAWVLAALLWCWQARSWSGHERVGMGALAVAAPLLWLLSDAIVTGNPLHSLTSTSELAEALGRDRGIGKAPRLFVVHLVDVARAPVALAGVLGMGLAVCRFGVRAMAVPLGLVVTGAVTFFGAGVAGLSLLPRYLTVPAVGLCLFAGYAVAGYASLPVDHRLRHVWQRGAIVVGVLGVAFFITKLPSFATLAGELRFVDRTHRELMAVLDEDAVRESRACGPITFPTYRLVPDTRWVKDLAGRDVSTRATTRPAGGVAVFIDRRDTKARVRFGEADGVRRATNRQVPPGFTLRAVRGPFRVYGRC